MKANVLAILTFLFEANTSFPLITSFLTSAVFCNCCLWCRTAICDPSFEKGFWNLGLWGLRILSSLR